LIIDRIVVQDEEDFAIDYLTLCKTASFEGKGEAFFKEIERKERP
jgi:hypothetical protein